MLQLNLFLIYHISQLDNGGETGIRTLGTCEDTHTFQACTLNHSAISPKKLLNSTIKC